MTRTIAVWIESGRRIERESIEDAFDRCGDVHFQNDVRSFDVKSGERPQDGVPGFMTFQVPAGGGKPEGMEVEAGVFLPRELSIVADIEQDRLTIKTDIRPTEAEIAAAIAEL